MKKLVLNILTIITFCFLISGCVDKIPPHPELECEDVQTYIECPAPEKPVYGLFNSELHMGHLGNLEMMKENLENSLRYNDSLENTLDCYKKQAEKPNE
jgi:hypothetical protein